MERRYWAFEQVDVPSQHNYSTYSWKESKSSIDWASPSSLNASWLPTATSEPDPSDKPTGLVRDFRDNLNKKTTSSVTLVIKYLPIKKKKIL